MFFEYLSQNITYVIIVSSAIALCIIGSVLKCVIMRKIKKKEEAKSSSTEDSGENQV